MPMLPDPAGRPLPEPDTGAPLDIVFVEGLRGLTIIGIDDGELHAPQPLLVDVHAGVPRFRACDTDRIGDTIHYGLVRERLLRLFAEHRFQLLEAFAEAVAEIVIVEFGAAWVRVKVAKPRKFDDVEAVGVQIERRAPPPDRGAALVKLLGTGLAPGRR